MLVQRETFNHYLDSDLMTNHTHIKYTRIKLYKAEITSCLCFYLFKENEDTIEFFVFRKLVFVSSSFA